MQVFQKLFGKSRPGDDGYLAIRMVAALGVMVAVWQLGRIWHSLSVILNGRQFAAIGEWMLGTFGLSRAPIDACVTAYLVALVVAVMYAAKESTEVIDSCKRMGLQTLESPAGEGALKFAAMSYAVTSFIFVPTVGAINTAVMHTPQMGNFEVLMYWLLCIMVGSFLNHGVRLFCYPGAGQFPTALRRLSFMVCGTTFFPVLVSHSIFNCALLAGLGCLVYWLRPLSKNKSHQGSGQPGFLF